ncbi:hypothetical protein BN2475_40095 [Paraburkholderia ribeironis]|uniref:TOTE conflict system primase domain-containing protein n=1 Tax=Paraburkholderia ribeironis TaxID=1247936 RepID=A0A1N7RJQ2_9BURK|nr:AAA family ATPase [Paraburkholderia ribeironis]SIT35284.1 hypothetical protein BN2475_40095 [Paraburkholderia ribeironis]
MRLHSITRFSFIDVLFLLPPAPGAARAPGEGFHRKHGSLWKRLLASLYLGVEGGEDDLSARTALLEWIQPLTQRLRGDIHAVKGGEGPACVYAPLPEATLRAHLTGGAQVGLYLMAKGSDTTRVALLDLDSHKGATSWPDMVATARRLIGHADRRGLKAHEFRSSGGRGIHLIFIWDEPQHAYSVRALLREVLAGEGLTDGTGGVVASQGEVFPKQDVGTRCGHMFVLPLGGKSLPLDLYGDPADDLPGEEALMPRHAVLDSEWKWQCSDAVPVLERPVRAAVSVDNMTIGLRHVKALCDLIPNSGEHEIPYEGQEAAQGGSYIPLMAAVYRATGGSEEGKELFIEMAGRSGKLKLEDVDHRWPSIERTSGPTATVRTLINAAKFYAPEAAHAIEHGMLAEDFDSVDAPQEGQPVKKSFLGDLNLMRVGGFLDTLPAPRRFLFANFLPAATVALAGAAGGTGKSQLSIQAGLCLATGDKLAGQWEVKERGASLLLCSEDESEELHRRVHNTFGQMTADDDEETKRAKRAAIVNSFFVTSLVGNDVRLLKQEQRGGWSVNTARVQEIIDTAKQIPGLKLIVLDPASRFRGGDENDADGATRFIEVLEGIRAATGATVLVTAHVNKTSIRDDDPSNTAFRGSSGLTDGARMTFMMSTLTEAAAKKKDVPVADRWKYVRVDSGKFNYGPPVREVWLKKGVGGFLHRADATEVTPEQAATDKEGENDLRGRIVTLIRDRAVPKDGEEGRYYTVTGFREAFGGVNKVLGASQYELRELLPAMLRDGHLKEIQPPGAKRSVLAPGDMPVEQGVADDFATDDPNVK